MFYNNKEKVLILGGIHDHEKYIILERNRNKLEDKLFNEENEINRKEIETNTSKKEINTSKNAFYTKEIKINNENHAINIFFFAFNHAEKK